MHTTLVGSRYFHSTLNKVVKHVEKHNYRFELNEKEQNILIITRKRTT